jgi:Uma2 family endonuclease
MPTEPIVTNIAALDPDGFYSYADYLRWQFGEKVELLKGKLFRMPPAPNLKHQRISFDLGLMLGNHFMAQKCRVFSAPFDVRLLDGKKSLGADQDIYTVVQPDLCVICDKAKLDEQGCVGAPDLIVEILSKGNTAKEMKIKYELYEENGVKEYWVVYPYEENILQFGLNGAGKYELLRIYVTDDHLTSPLFPDLSIPLVKIFAED